MRSPLAYPVAPKDRNGIDPLDLKEHAHHEADTIEAETGAVVQTVVAEQKGFDSFLEFGRCGRVDLGQPLAAKDIDFYRMSTETPFGAVGGVRENPVGRVGILLVPEKVRDGRTQTLQGVGRDETVGLEGTVQFVAGGAAVEISFCIWRLACRLPTSGSHVCVSVWHVYVRERYTTR